VLTTDRGDRVAPAEDDSPTDQVVDGIAQPHPEHPSRQSFGSRDRTLIRRSAAGGLITGLVPFVCVLWDFGFRPARVAGPQGIASNFYDIQARALMHGHLSVPTGSLGIEGFVIDDRTFMYFPPFPAVLRIPVLMITDRFDGRLTAPSMLLAWFVLAAATVALAWNVRIMIRGFVPVTRCE